MKKIEEVIIWDNGVNKKAKILNAYVTRLNLNKDAWFSYTLFSENELGFQGEVIRQDSIYMSPENYALWNTDDVAWDFVAAELKLKIIGDYIPPAPLAPIETNI